MDTRPPELEGLVRRLAAIEGSTFWRASWPARQLLEKHPTAARQGRRALKLVWWSVTLQLPVRLRGRRDARSAARAHPEPPAVSMPAVAAVDRALARPPLALPTSPAPLVSIIVPAYGQVPATLRCLEAIAASATTTPFEVIVAEDASGDADVALYEAVQGLRLQRNDRNLGFLHNCNEAALLARGRYLLFLNNDTEPRPGFLDALVRLMEARPDAGLVGAKLLFPDGRLQEAGGIIWGDGTGWNWGRGDDPGRPQYNAVRQTDYVSGAAILVPRDLFEALGGFDPRFAPAYYEDVDFAFRIRARGRAVLFQPASLVVHHEGLSHGTDVTQGVKAAQERNRHVLLATWPRLLAAEHAPPGHPDLLRARHHGRGRRTILVIDHYVPEPDRDAGSRSALAILEALVAAGWLVVFWPQNRAHNGYTARLESMGIEVLDNRLGEGFTGWIERHGPWLDHVLVLRPTVAVEFASDLLRFTRARLSFYGVDIHHVRMRRQAALLGDEALAAEAEAMAVLEQRLWGLFDILVYPSEAEAASIRAARPWLNVHGIVPFSFDRFTARDVPPPEPVILFVAGFAHPPNIDAAQWLVADILPRVRRERPEARLVLAGSHPTPAVQALAGPLVTVTGNLSDADLAAQYASARVAAVPLRAGAGVKGKVVEALAEGLPLVTTPVGAEGIPELDDVATVTADAAAFADALLALLADDALWLRQSAAQAALARRHFSRDALARRLFAVLDAPLPEAGRPG